MTRRRQPLPADSCRCWCPRTSTTACNLPDLVILRFRDAEPHGAGQVQHQDRRRSSWSSATSNGVDHAGAADHRRGHRAGGGVRRDRHVHRRPRVRPRAPALPRPAHRDLHAGHRVRRGEEGRPAGRAARRHGRRDDHGVRPRLARAGSPTGSSSTGWPARSGTRWRSRTASSSSARPSRRQDAPAPTSDQAEPAAPAPGHRPACASGPSSPRPSRSRRCRSGGGTSRSKKALVGTAPAKTSRRSCSGPGVAPPELAKTFGDPVYVATRRALPRPVRGRRRGEGARRSRSPARPPSSRAPPAATRRSAPAPRSRSTTSARRSTASTWSPPRGTATTRPPATPRTSRSPAARSGRCSGSPPAAAARVGR